MLDCGAGFSALEQCRAHCRIDGDFDDAILGDLLAASSDAAAAYLGRELYADQAALDNLKVQKSYTMIRAPFAGRISAANVKVGNFVRPADTTALAVINQMAPVYVTFSIPQRVLVDLRESMAKGASGVTATIPGHQRTETGKVVCLAEWQVLECVGRRGFDRIDIVIEPIDRNAAVRVVKRRDQRRRRMHRIGHRAAVPAGV